MNVMSIDVEFNQPSRKVIQIGAAAYEPKSGMLLDRMEIFVNPNEPIEPFIIGLTGIRDQDVKNGHTIIQAYEELRSFAKKNKVFQNPLVWGSGIRNDSQAIWEQTGLDGENFMGFRVLDVKTIFQSVQLYNDGRHGMGLEECCAKLGIGFEGSTHTALADAMNTFRVWHFLMRNFNDTFNKRK